MYNDDLIDIMREHSGWWYKKERCWQFPVSKFSELYDDLKKNLYAVDVLNLEEK